MRGHAHIIITYAESVYYSGPLFFAGFAGGFRIHQEPYDSLYVADVIRLLLSVKAAVCVYRR